MAKANFISTILSKYVALATKDPSTLYFVEDAKRIYKGDVDVTEAIKVVESFDETPGADVAAGKIYLNATTFEAKVSDGTAWVTMLPGIVSTADDFDVEANASKLATVGATKEYITELIADITGGTAFVKDVTWDAEGGVLKVDKGEDTPASVELTGVAHTVVYDKANLKLTIPVYGQDDLVINIPKDNFVRSGRYEADYQLPDGSTGPAIVLVVDDEESDTDNATTEVVIPAASLVDVYTGTTSENVKVTVSEDNKITATVVIDPEAGNALVSTATGLRVDVSGKADKLTADAAGHILVGAADGDLADSGLSVKAEGDMGDAATEVPVAAVIAAAIAKAIQEAQQTTADQLNLITNDQKTGRLDVLEKKVEEIGTSIIGEGNADEVIISTESGIARSGKKVGGATLAETPDADTLATEAAVSAAVSDATAWGTLE